MDDADILGGMANDDRNQRNQRKEQRGRSYTIEGAVTTSRYILPVHVADDITVTGVGYKLRTGTATIELLLHDAETFTQTYSVTTTNTNEFDVFAEDMERGELVRLSATAASGASDLTFTLYFI